MPSVDWHYEPADEPVIMAWDNGQTATAVGEWIHPTAGWVDVWLWRDGGNTFVCWRNDDAVEVPVEGNYPTLPAAMDAVETAAAAALEVCDGAN